jgi:hypothetical protein
MAARRVYAAPLFIFWHSSLHRGEEMRERKEREDERRGGEKRGSTRGVREIR